MFIIKSGDILKNKDLQKFFQCGLQGGMRRRNTKYKTFCVTGSELLNYKTNV